MVHFHFARRQQRGTYNGLAFASAEEVSPGFVLGIVNQQENLLLFCTNHMETWYDAGTPIFPFQRIDGATVERGTAAGLTAVKEDNSVFFLGDDLIFYRLDNFIPRRVSTHAEEDSWKSYTVVSDAYTFSFTYEGHKFIVLTFPSANATWIFDIATNFWHRSARRGIRFEELLWPLARDLRCELLQSNSGWGCLFRSSRVSR